MKKKSDAAAAKKAPGEVAKAPGRKAPLKKAAPKKAAPKKAAPEKAAPEKAAPKAAPGSTSAVTSQDASPRSVTRRAVLEAAIRENRDDPAAYLVLADALQGAGDPLGELIVLQHATHATPNARKAARIGAIVKGFDLPAEDLATFGWRWGLWSWLRLENSRDWMDDEFSALDLAVRLFGAPMCVALEELRIGVLRWESNHEDVPEVLGEAASHAWAKSLTRLHLGDVESDVDMSHHVIGDIGPIVSSTFPALTSLKLHSGQQDWRTDDETFGVAGLDLPRLTDLVIETCAMSQARLAGLLEARLPRLRKLELWFGSEEGADCTLDDLAPLLDGRVFGGVRELGLRNAEIAGDLARALPESALAPRLEALDLSMGTLDDATVAALVSGAPRFSALKTLSLDDNFLSEPAIASVRAAFPGVTIVSSSQKEVDASDPESRYVTVWE